MRTIRQILLFATLLLLDPVIVDAADDVLFEKSKTSYHIIISSQASVTEQTAAVELRDYLERISGAKFTLSSTPGRRNIFVGYDSAFAVFRNVEPFSDQSDGFIIKKDNHDLMIYGGRERGTMYGVFRFLQEFFGVQWYTPDYTKVPIRKKFILGNIHLAEAPRIKYRYTDFFCAQDIPWMAHNFMNTRRNNKDNTYGVFSRYWGTHSMGSLLPVSKYFASHKEYFALWQGKRISNGQLCLSNPAVLKIVTKEILSVIERHPEYTFYDVSQKDNKRYCTCKRCVALEKKYGGHSGLMIWFVNQVAKEVKNRYPDKYIGTFAYQYTRNAPTNIKPEDNVVIRLCDIECCFAHPLSDECNSNNSAFMKDLKDWSKLTDNLFIWDYIVNYSNYMAPFPNIQVLGPNLKTFAENNVIEVYEEAQSGTMGNAFEELKCWVLGQLMWNPNRDTDELVSMFINDYYGESASDIKAYYNLCLALIKDNSHLRCFADPKKAPFNDDFITDAYKVLEKALNNAENEIISERVKKVMLQPAALECARHPKEFYKSGKWTSFKSQLLKYGAYFEAGVSPTAFINSFEAKVK